MADRSSASCCMGSGTCPRTQEDRSCSDRSSSPLSSAMTAQLSCRTSSPGSLSGFSRYRLPWHSLSPAACHPERGLFTAIVAGFLISLLGGSRVQIGGPTGAFVVIVSAIVGEYGYEGLVYTTIMAGILLVVLGLTRMGNLVKFIPYPVTTGFTTGIAVVIFSTQIRDLLGLTMGATPAGFVEKWVDYGTHLQTINPSAGRHRAAHHRDDRGRAAALRSGSGDAPRHGSRDCGRVRVRSSRGDDRQPVRGSATSTSRARSPIAELPANHFARFAGIHRRHARPP